MTAILRSLGISYDTYRDGRGAIVASVAAIICLLSFGALFPNETAGAIRVWVVSPTFNHCFLVLPVSLFLIWQRRSLVAHTSPSPEFGAAWTMLVLVCAWLAASIIGVLEIKQFVVLAMVQATLAGVLGWNFYRKLAAPFLYLFFLVPSGAFLIPTLQAFTARFAVIGLQVLGIPVFSNGALIEIPAGSFAVAEACAGLRFLIAAVAFGVFFAVITYKSVYRRLVFICCSIVIPVVANGLRVLGLIAAAQWVGNPTAALADHLLYGWIFFSLVLLLLIFVGQLFSDTRKSDSVTCFAPSTTLAPRPPWSRMTWVALVCLVTAAGGTFSTSFWSSSQTLDVPTSSPRVSLPWRLIPSPSTWRPVVMSANRSFSETFVDEGYQVDRFVALYSGQGAANNLIRSDNREANEKEWRFNSTRQQTITVRGNAIPMSVSSWSDGFHRRIVWSFYFVNGEPVSGLWRVKWRQILAGLKRSNCISAYVAFSAIENDESTDTAAVSALLNSTVPLDAYLCSQTNRLAK